MGMCTINSLEDTKTRRMLLLQPVPKVGQTAKAVRRGGLSTVGNGGCCYNLCSLLDAKLHRLSRLDGLDARVYRVSGLDAKTHRVSCGWFGAGSAPRP